MVNIDRLRQLRNVLQLDRDLEQLEQDTPPGTFEHGLWVELRNALNARRAYVRSYYDNERREYEAYLVRVGADIDWDEVP